MGGCHGSSKHCPECGRAGHSGSHASASHVGLGRRRLGGARRVRGRARRRRDGGAARADAAAARRARARAGVRPGRSRARRGRAGGAGRRGRALGRRARDDRDREAACGGAAGSRTSRPASSTSSRSTSRTRPTTSCSAARGSCSFPIRPAPRGRSRGFCARAAASRLAVWGPREQNPWLGDRLRRGQRAARLAGAAPGSSRAVLARRSPTGSQRLLAGAGLADVSVRELPTPVPRGVRRGVVDEDGRARRPARGSGSRRCPAPAAQALLARARAAIGAYETPAGLEIPGLSLIAGATAPGSSSR